MSNFTTEVRFICEEAAGFDESQERNKVHDVITAAMPKIFDFDFPIFDEEYRPVLERKILMHYYTREIALETVGLWKLKLETRLNEIMPHYNHLYEIEMLEYNPLWDVDLTEDKTQVVDTDTSGSESRIGNSSNVSDGQRSTQTAGNTSDSNTELYSDTPQGQITNLAEGKYLTNATMNNGEGSSTSLENVTTHDTAAETNSRSTMTTGTLDTTDQYVKHIKGKRGSLTYSKMAEEELALRDKIGNIDLRIIRDLKDLFFTLWC